MVVATAEIRFHAPWVHSLKEKRMEVKSMIARVQNRFHLSAAEVDDQDLHQSIVIGIACVAQSAVEAEKVVGRAVDFLENSTDAEMTDVKREIR